MNNTISSGGAVAPESEIAVSWLFDLDCYSIAFAELLSGDEKTSPGRAG